jgi:hypothetical protein
VDRWNVFSEVVRSRAPRADAYKCYSTSDGEYIEWTRDDLKIFAWMKAPKGQRRELLEGVARGGADLVGPSRNV